jgi:hypothetical protein
MRGASTAPFTLWRAIRWAAMVAVVGLLATSFASVSQAGQSDRVTPRTAADGANGSFSFLNGSTAVLALAFFDDSLIAGSEEGPFLPSDDTAIAGWSGGAWAPLGRGLASPVVFTLTVQDDTLIAAGNFVGARDDTGTGLISGTSGIAAFANGRWHSMRSIGTPPPTIYSLAVMDDTLYAGGQLDDTLAGPAGTAIAQWGDDTWSPLGAGLNLGAGTNMVLAAGDDTLYVGGRFVSWVGVTPGLATPGLAAWSDDTWHAPVPPADDLSGDDTTVILSMVVQDDTLYVGGNLYLPGGSSSTRYIAAQADGTWHALGSGVNAPVTALAVDETHGLVYAGGIFPNPRSADDTLIAQAFDTGTGEWIALDDSSATSPFSFNTSSPRSFAVDDSVVYIGAGNIQGRGDTGGSVIRWTWEAPTATLTTTSGFAGSTVDVTGWSLIGVDSVRFDGTSAIISRDDSTSLTATVPNLSPGTYPVTVSAVGGTTTAGTFTVNAPPPPPPAPMPPGAPTAVTATAGDASATLTWQAPANPGTYPVTSYQVESVPGGQSCLASSLTCEITGLTNGTTYTFRARALSGAGWGAWSTPSNAVTPSTNPTPTSSIQVTGTREGRIVTVTGSTTGFGMGGMVTSHVRTARGTRYIQGSTVLVDIAGEFTWSRQLSPRKTLWVYFTGDGVKSNILRLSP